MAVHGSDESKPLACSECGKRFLSNSALACHLKVHATEMFSYDCPICSQPFDQIHALKEHVHIHRINNVYTCPHCLKVCTSTYVFYAHRYNTHHPFTHEQATPSGDFLEKNHKNLSY